MSETAAVRALLQPRQRVRYLKLIALFKIAKGALLFLVGFSLLFLNARVGWMDTVSDWADAEILLGQQPEALTAEQRMLLKRMNENALHLANLVSALAKAEERHATQNAAKLQTRVVETEFAEF